MIWLLGSYETQIVIYDSSYRYFIQYIHKLIDSYGKPLA